MEPDDERPIDLPLTYGELYMINNALNEVCNGVHIADFEFYARLGVTREQTQALLEKVHRRLVELAV